MPVVGRTKHGLGSACKWAIHVLLKLLLFSYYCVSNYDHVCARLKHRLPCVCGHMCDARGGAEVRVSKAKLNESVCTWAPLLQSAQDCWGPGTLERSSPCPPPFSDSQRGHGSCDVTQPSPQEPTAATTPSSAAHCAVALLTRAWFSRVQLVVSRPVTAQARAWVSAQKMTSCPGACHSARGVTWACAATDLLTTSCTREKSPPAGGIIEVLRSETM